MSPSTGSPIPNYSSVACKLPLLFRVYVKLIVGLEVNWEVGLTGDGDSTLVIVIMMVVTCGQHLKALMTMKTILLV